MNEDIKSNAIKTLAGGVAHDFNNLLMGIQGNVSLMLLNTDSSHPNYKRLKNIEKNIKSGAEITTKILGFAKGGKYSFSFLNINPIVRYTAKIFKITRDKIKIHENYQKNIFTVRADKTQLEKVLHNLYANALDAMLKEGHLYLKTKNVLIDDSFSDRLNLTRGRYVKISVTDTGRGMDKATCKRVFDPYFTTKEMKRGTGLGLAFAAGIIKNHGGIITASSEKGSGSTFEIYLPALSDS